MRLTHKMQTALLFCLYLTRAGRVNASVVGDILNLDVATLNDILLSLSLAQIVDSESGDYSLIGNPTVDDILKAVSHKPTLTAKETAVYRQGQHEHRALALLADKLTTAVAPILSRTIRGIGNDLVIAEISQMDSASGLGN